MSRMSRFHDRHTLVVAYLALAVALSGTALAAKATIGSDDIIDGQVKTRDLGGQAVTSGKVDSSAITGAHVKNGSLKQADIKKPALKTPATLLGDWENYEPQGATPHPVRFWKDASGMVHLEGAVRGGSAMSNIFQLPPGYRPAANYVDFPVITTPGDFDATIGYVEVQGPAAGEGSGECCSSRGSRATCRWTASRSERATKPSRVSKASRYGNRRKRDD